MTSREQNASDRPYADANRPAATGGSVPVGPVPDGRGTAGAADRAERERVASDRGGDVLGGRVTGGGCWVRVLPGWSGGRRGPGASAGRWVGRVRSGGPRLRGG